MESFYQAERVNDRITAIRSMTGEIMYLIEGTEKAVLVDTCLGVGHLKNFVASVTKKPVTVLLTHGHIDHAMGAPEFDDVYMNSADNAVFISHRPIANRKDYIAQNLGGRLPDFIKDEDFVPEAEPHFHELQDGAVFDPGGIHIESYSLPGHTKGSMVLLIKEERILIAGDACNNSTFLFDENSLRVSEYRKNLVKIQNRLSGQFDRVFLCHHVMEAKPEIISNVIQVCDDVLNGTADDIPFAFMGQTAYIAKKCNERFEREDGKEGNIIYSKEKL